MLFEKNILPELCSKFTESRFSEKNMFKRPDIVDWLLGFQDGAHSLQEGDYVLWNELITNFADRIETSFETFLGGSEMCVDVLYAIGCPYLQYVKAENGNFPFEHLDHKWVVKTFVLREYATFMFTGGMIHAIQNGNRKMVLLYRNDFSILCRNHLRATDVARSALLAWAHGNNPNATAAKEKLCSWLWSCIETEQKKAEQDFYSAIAASPDGSKVLHADFVLYYSNLGLQILPSPNFHKKQLLFVRQNSLLRFDTAFTNAALQDSPTDSVMDLFTFVPDLIIARSKNLQTFFSFKDKNGKRHTCFTVPCSILYYRYITEQLEQL